MSVIWSGVTEEGAVVPVQVTAEGKVVAIGDGPEGDYLELTGGQLTGPLTSTSTASFTGSLSTDNNIAAGGNASIEGNVSAGYGDPSTGCLLSANGNASFSSYINVGGTADFAGGETSISADGTIEIGANPNGSGNVGLSLATTGGLITRTTLNPSVKIFPPTGTTPSISLNRDGTADFAGKLTTGGTLRVGGEPWNFQKGAAVAAGTITSVNTAGSLVWYGGVVGGSTTSSINSDGSCTFAGGNCGFTAEGELIFTSRNTTYKLVVSDGFLFPEPYTRAEGGVSMDIEDPQ